MSGVLHAAKFGKWPQFRQKLEESAEVLTFENFNKLPPGRSFGVIHQIGFQGNDDARVVLVFLLEMHPRVNLKMKTKDGQTVLDEAQGEGANTSFLDYLCWKYETQFYWCMKFFGVAEKNCWGRVVTLYSQPQCLR